MDVSLLGKLPAELRNNVYELVLVVDTVKLAFNASMHSTCKHPTVTGLEPHHLALTKTCQQLHSESIVVFYGKNDFVFTMGPSSCNNYSGSSSHPLDSMWKLSVMLRSIGYENARSVRKVKIQICFPETFNEGRPLSVLSCTDVGILAVIARFLQGKGAKVVLDTTLMTGSSFIGDVWQSETHDLSDDHGDHDHDDDHGDEEDGRPTKNTLDRYLQSRGSLTLHLKVSSGVRQREPRRMEWFVTYLRNEMKHPGPLECLFEQQALLHSMSRRNQTVRGPGHSTQDLNQSALVSGANTQAFIGTTLDSKEHLQKPQRDTLNFEWDTTMENCEEMFSMMVDEAQLATDEDIANETWKNILR